MLLHFVFVAVSVQSLLRQAWLRTAVCLDVCCNVLAQPPRRCIWRPAGNAFYIHSLMVARRLADARGSRPARLPHQRLSVAAARRDRSLTPPASPPSSDSEADVMRDARSAVISRTRVLAKHWASGSSGRAAPWSLTLSPADHAALAVRDRREAASALDHAGDPSMSEVEELASGSLGARAALTSSSPLAEKQLVDDRGPQAASSVVELQANETSGAARTAAASGAVSTVAVQNASEPCAPRSRSRESSSDAPMITGRRRQLRPARSFR